MYPKTKCFTFAVFLTSVFGDDFSQIVAHDFSAMLKRGDAISKRQGYYPSSAPCGSGTTCAEACGTGQVECPADSGRGACFDPSQSHCCPDGSGYSCESGYFCSSDGQQNTYCCLNGMDLGACAEAYSLTVSLISQTGTVDIPSATEAGSNPAFVTISTSTTPVYITSSPSSLSSPVDINILPTSTVPAIPPVNGSYTTGTPPVEFPGAASKVVGMGMAIIVGVVGVLGML